MRYDLTNDEMKEYIDKLECQVRYMGVLIEAYEKLHKNIRELSERLEGWLSLDGEEYAEKYSACCSNEVHIDPSCAYAGKTGQASSTISSILINLNSTESSYQRYKDDIAFLEGACAKYRSEPESENPNE